MKQSSAFVHLPGEGRVLDMGSFQMTLKAEAAGTGGTLSLLEATEPAGFGPPMHIHHDAAEAFYVLDGEYVIFIEEDEHRCPAGSFVFVPAGVRHGFRVGAAESRKLNIYAPAAMVGYFDELVAANASGTPPSEEALGHIAARYGMEVLGPVPEGYV